MPIGDTARAPALKTDMFNMRAGDNGQIGTAHRRPQKGNGTRAPRAISGRDQIGADTGPLAPRHHARGKLSLGADRKEVVAKIMRIGAAIGH